MKRYYLSEEEKKKFVAIKMDCENDNRKLIRCPVCKHLLIKGQDDIKGHIQIKCPKCKTESLINLLLA